MWGRIVVGLVVGAGFGSAGLGCGDVVNKPADAAPPDMPMTACPGLEMRTNVLGNAGFEVMPCTPTMVGSWLVEKDVGWTYYVNRPLVSDNTGGCGFTNYGCDGLNLDMFPNTGNGCLEIFGNHAEQIGEWVQVRQTYRAPAPIKKFALAWSRGSLQLSWGWEYDLSYSFAAAPTLVETMRATNDPLADPMGRFATGIKEAPGTTTDITVSIRLRRTGTGVGYGYVFVDDVTLDVCY